MDVTCATPASIFAPSVEKDLDDADAVERLRLDVLDVVDRGGHGTRSVTVTMRCSISSGATPA